MMGMSLDITEKKTEQRKDDFLSKANHELERPVVSIKAFMQLLERIKDQPFSAIHSRLTEQANKSVLKTEPLAEELLNTSRLSEDQLKLERTSFNLYELLSGCFNHIPPGRQISTNYLRRKTAQRLFRRAPHILDINQLCQQCGRDWINRLRFSNRLFNKEKILNKMY